MTSPNQRRNRSVALVALAGILGFGFIRNPTSFINFASRVIFGAQTSLESIIDQRDERFDFKKTGFPRERCDPMLLIIRERSDDYFLAEIGKLGSESLYGSVLVTYQPMIHHLFGPDPLDHNKPNVKVCWDIDSLCLLRYLGVDTDSSPQYRTIELSYDGTAPDIRKTVRMVFFGDETPAKYEDDIPGLVEMYTKQDFPDPASPNKILDTKFTLDGFYVNPNITEARDALDMLKKNLNSEQRKLLTIHTLTDSETQKLADNYHALVELGKP
ncbi:MAG: hypothetical protein ABIB47_00745 [Candidatus Woesearchaeota archaeon]